MRESRRRSWQQSKAASSTDSHLSCSTRMVRWRKPLARRRSRSGATSRFLIRPNRERSLDLLDGLDVSEASEDEIAKIVGRAIVDAASSHLPHDWTGVRWQQLARAAGEIAITAPTEHALRYEDVGRLMIDQELLDAVLVGHPRADSHSALVLRQLTREQDKAGTGLWASSKFDSIARSAIARSLSLLHSAEASVSDK